MAAKKRKVKQKRKADGPAQSSRASPGLKAARGSQAEPGNQDVVEQDVVEQDVVEQDVVKQDVVKQDVVEQRVESTAGESKPVQTPIAGIGASAGGLDAFKKFFTAMPADSGVAFVLIPHLDPKHESLMVELLARHTKMHVVEAADGMAVEANHVYILPPNKYMTILGGVLQLTGPVERGGWQTSIDLFLRSLADDQQERAICIILSGTGAHGTLGLKAVKAAGGMAMVQDPTSAEHPRMPQSAIATGLADYVLAPDKLPEALIKYVQHFYVNGGVAGKVVEAPDHLNQILAVLRARAKFDFRFYRKKMLTRRIERRMGLNHFENLEEYVAHLRDHPEEVKHLSRDLLISVTCFFRDPDALEVLARDVIAPLVRSKPSDATLRIWVPSCATGEEAYTIAILVFEALAKAQKSCRLQLFATDVDEDALETARQGVYPESISADVSPERLARFFTRVNDVDFQINKPVREAVVFAVQNLIADAPFSKMDLVSCRNMLIYLEPEVQKKVVSLLHFSLNEGGHLLLGPSETIGRQTDLFEPVSKKWRVFRRIGPSRPERVEFPIASAPDAPGPPRRPAEHGAPRHVRFADLTQRLVMEELAPAAVLINRKYEVLYFLGPTSRYLEVPTGEPTQDLFAMAREGMRTRLRGAVHKAIQDNQKVTLTDIQVRRNGDYHPIAVTVRPAPSTSASEGLLLVLFQDLPETPSSAKPTRAQAESMLLKQLEYELRAAKEDLQSTIEEMESSNEELKASNEEVMSMNEEMQSANEELETSKEELQSLNEELNTVNNQLQEKVDQLEDTHNDMTNLLNCTDIATVFLDTDFRIRRYTPAATQLLNFIGTDVGRPLTDISPKYPDSDLLADAQHVLHHLSPREKEIRTPDGRGWIRRFVPYRTADNRIEGVVLTYSDVTQLKRAGEQARLLATVMVNSSDAILVHDFEGKLTHWNRGAENLYGYSADEALRTNVRRLMSDANWKTYRDILERLQHGEQLSSFESQRIAKDGRVIDVWVTVTTLTDDAGKPTAIAKIDRDITERKKAQAHLEQEVEHRTADLKESAARLGAILNAPDDAIITINRAGIVESVNAAAVRMFGYSAEEMIGKNVKMLMPPPDRDRHDQYLKRYLATGDPHIIGIGREVEARRKDGSTFPVDLSVSEVAELGLFTGILRDITRRKELEREVVEIAALEQRRIGQDLHDECGQELTALRMFAEALADSLQERSPNDVPIVVKLRDGIAHVLRQVRDISHGLNQSQLKAKDLSTALLDLTVRLEETSGVRCKSTCGEDLGLDDNQASHYYRIAAEAMTNALKHASPKNIDICLESIDHAVVLEIKDDGTGMTKSDGGLGLRIMRNRAAVIGATLSIGPAKPTGTLVTCTLKTTPQEPLV
jgi:two-component system CheB/CheR fusion protein